MIRHAVLLIGLALLAWLALPLWPVGIVDASELPRVFLLDPLALAEVKAAIGSGDIAYDAALARLVRDADSALKQGPFTVMDKPVTPPGGDKHDYLSQSTYYWPDPDKPDGLPYIYRDGERNPEIDQTGDAQSFGRLKNAVSSLALAYYFTDDEKYAEHAARLLRVWFLDPATRMNPNLDHAQFAPGRNTGTYSGIIDTWDVVPPIIDAIGLLEGSRAWTAADRRGIRQWLTAYLDWLLKSDFGVREGRTTNNHSTFYDTQVVSIALFLGRQELASQVLQAVPARRIATQIEPDGSQPRELARTRSWHYSVFNLQAFFRLASLGDRVGVDLWTYETEDGRSIQRALDFLIPYGIGDETWPYQEITGMEDPSFYQLLRQAAIRYSSPEYKQASLRIAPAGVESSRVSLTVPLLPEAGDAPE